MLSLYRKLSSASVKAPDSSSSFTAFFRKNHVSTGRMSVTGDQIRSKLIKELGATHVEVVDESDGCGGKFSCVIVSDKFRGKPLLQRHRLVNSALQEELKSVHAFSQKTLTPEQWDEQKS